MCPNRPPRAPGFSYLGPHAYFVTICTERRQARFRDDTPARWLVEQILHGFDAEHFALLAYCVMPDHVHLLLEGLTDGADFRAAIHAFKLKSGFDWKRQTGQHLWQHGFHDRVLRDHDSVPGVVRYILYNPIRAGLTDDVTEYPHVGSSRYQLAELVDAVVDWRPPWKLR